MSAISGCVTEHVSRPETAGSPAAAGRSSNGGSGSGGSGRAGAAGSRIPVVDAQAPPLPPPPPPPPPANPVACGTSQCPTPSNVAGDLLRGLAGLAISVPDAVSCCVNASLNQCGSAAMVGVECDVPAKPDHSCPGVDLSAITALVDGLGEGAQRAMTGCCTKGACGLDGDLFGRGCVENSDAKRMLSMVPLVGPLIHVPDPRPCAGSDLDAGI